MVAMNENYSNRRTGVATPDGGVTTYTWTDDNQLAAVANSGGTASNTHDGGGLTPGRTDSHGTDSFLWNPQVLEAQLGVGNTRATAQ